MNRILLATKNPGKLAEARELLAELRGVEIVTPAETPFTGAPETGTTLLENAVQKALFACSQTGLPALAEDTGLDVVALGGEPGVHSARFAGSPPDPVRNNEMLLRRMEGVQDRTARFMTVAALCLPDDRIFVCSGMLRGRIAALMRGGDGFGYDPLFVPEGEIRSLAEMTQQEKNRISHRRRALHGMQLILADLILRGELQQGGSSLF